MKRTSCFSVAEPWHSSSETKSQHSRPKCCPWGHERKEEDNGAMWVAKSFVILRAARTWGRGYRLCAEPLAGGVGAPTRLPLGLTRRCWPLGDLPQSACSTPSTSDP